jgi:hypothetical protein
VLVVDETGDLKKGTATVGVARQYTGTAGRIENAQVAVYLTYAGARGHAMIDRELYLPRSWTSDPDRCAAAGVPEGIEFATKPALATGMLIRALNAGVPARWVAGDEVYGAGPGLRAELEARRVGYVLTVGCDRRVPTAAGLIRADDITAGLPKRAWHRLSAGPGAKGQRYYDWAWIAHPDPAGTADPGDGQCRWLLVRRHRRSRHRWRTRHTHRCSAGGSLPYRPPADIRHRSARAPPLPGCAGTPASHDPPASVSRTRSRADRAS